MTGYEFKEKVKQAFTDKNNFKWVAGAAAVFALIIMSVLGAYFYQNFRLDSAVNVNLGIEVKTNEKVLANNSLEEDEKIVIGEMPFINNESAAANAQIGADRAKEIVFSNAGVASESDVVKFEIEMDHEHDVTIYEVSFLYEKYKYDYEINAGTGEILEVKCNLAENKVNAENDGVKNAGDTKKEDKKAGAATDYIGEESAKEIVLLRAEIDASEIVKYSCESDIQKEIPVYKVKFTAKGYKYNCDVNALTGEIVKYNRQPEYSGR